MIVLYIVISLTNVFLHIVRSILVIKSSKLTASLANCICYTFSAVVIKFIAETDLWVAIAVQASTNFAGEMVTTTDAAISKPIFDLVYERKTEDDFEDEGEVGEMKF